MIEVGLTSHALHLYFIQHAGGLHGFTRSHRHESVYHLNRAADIYTKLNKYQNTITDQNTATRQQSFLPLNFFGGLSKSPAAGSTTHRSSTNLQTDTEQETCRQQWCHSEGQLTDSPTVWGELLTTSQPENITYFTYFSCAYF